MAQISTRTRRIISSSPEYTHQEHIPPEDVPYIVRALEVPSDELVFMDETTPSSTRDDASTARPKKGRSVKVSPNKLRYRRIHADMKSGRRDPKLAELNTKLKTEFPERAIEAIPQFRMLLARFHERADANQRESCYPFLDDLSYELDEEKSKIQFPTTNWRYFEANLKRCVSMNEAVLQRTIMMTVFNQYWLRDIFDWNTEGQWYQDLETRIPSSADDDLSLPKPDLAISFDRQSFTGFDISDPVPPKLEKCISPEGDSRCFPFLFMEVKKAASDLSEAFLANLNNASQALYNIYLWMNQADQKDEFLNNVRVFSLVFNAEDLSVRVHRVEEHKGNLFFFYDEVRTLARYDRNQAWVLVNSILENYAATELHPLLKSAYDTVCNQERDRVESKRKASGTQSTAAKRARSSRALEGDPNTSFGMSALST